MDYILRLLKRTAETSANAEDWRRYAQTLERSHGAVQHFTTSPDEAALWMAALRLQFDEWLKNAIQLFNPLITGPPDAYLLSSISPDPRAFPQQRLNCLIILNTDDPRIYLDDFHIVSCIDAVITGSTIRTTFNISYQYNHTVLLHDTDGRRVLLLLEILWPQAEQLA